MAYKTSDIVAQDNFTEPLNLDPGERGSISVSNTFVATVTLQRRFYTKEGPPTSWVDVLSWTGPVETTAVADEHQEIRLGVKSGDFTSGTVTARIGVNA